MDVSASNRSPVAAGLASSMLPGLGQMMTGAIRAGGLLAGLMLLVTAISTMAVIETSRLAILQVMTDPDLLLVLVAANLVLGLLRLLTASDAWHRAGGRWLSIGIVTLMAFTAIPHVALGYYVLETRETLVNVFALEPPETIPPTTTTSSSTTSTTTTTLPDNVPLFPPMAIATSSTTSSTTTTTTTIPLGAPRVTFLLVGTDAGPGRPGARTDAMMVATVDTMTGEAAIFGLPRNMAGFKFSDGSDFEGLTRGILNEVYMWGERNPDRFPGPEPGVNALVDVAETTLGLPIDHYVMVDMIGFARLIDALGGVTVNVPYRFNAPLYDRDTGQHETIAFDPGTSHLSGDLALAFARSRTDSNDYARMSRQRCLMGAVVDQAGPLTLAKAYPQILDVFEDSITTDIPLNRLPFLLNFAPSVSTDRITAVGFDTEYRTGERTKAGYPISDFERIRGVVRSVIDGTGDVAPTDLPTIDGVC